MSQPLPRSAGPVAPDPRWLATVAEASPVPLFVASEAGLLYASAAWEGATGWTPAELLGRRLADFTQAEAVERVREWEDRVAAGEQPPPLEAPFRARDGRVLWLEVHAAPFATEAGLCTVGVALEVSERHRRQVDLAQNEDWFRALAETTATAVIVYGADRIRYANRACEVLTGYSQEELLGMPAWLPTHPDHREISVQRMTRRLRGEPVDSRYELKILTKQGEIRWVDYTAGLVPLGGETVALGTAFDITEQKHVEFALRESNERLELAQRGAGIFTWEWDLRSDALILPEHAAELFGCTPEELWKTGTAYFEAVLPEDQTRLAEALRPCMRAGHDLSVQVRVLCPDRAVRWVSERGRVLPDAAGSPARIIGVAHDITKRKQAEEALDEERERAQVTLASIGDGVIRTDREGRVDYLNPVAERLTGWSAAEALGQPLGRVFQVLDEVARKPLPDPVERCLREGRAVELPGPLLLVRRDGIEFAVRDSVAPVRDREGRISGSVVVFKDVSELRGMERQMRFLARHDPLTGLLNRRELERRLGRAIELAQEDAGEHALLYLDLDDFKLVNDSCGHVAGDELLKQVAAELASELPAGAALARLGGDEFGVLLAETSAAEARAVAEAIRARVTQFRFTWEERVFRVGLSLGLVPITGASGGLDQVLSAADAACYVARERGDRIHEWQADDTAVAERSGELQWVQRIPHALEEGRFLLFCQPIVPLGPAATEKLCEILLRLRDESGELVSPAAFIPAAERYRLIGTIDRWVVRAALDALAGGRVAGDPATCYAINLSGQSLGDESFLDYVLAEIAASGVPPSRLCFEVTETAAVANLARARRTIAALKGLGCRFILDDFGSGLSSFAYLKNLAVDFLKIDGEFVRGMTAGSVEWALVASIHQIGHVMGIRTIAESVEDAETLEAVRSLGIDYAQGYAIARPEPLSTPAAND